MKKFLKRILSTLFRALGVKGDTRPLQQKRTGDKPSFTKHLRERQRKQRTTKKEK